VDPATRLRYTFNQGEGTEAEILATVDLETVEEGTRITLTVRCASREQREFLAPYAAEGTRAAWDRLEKVLLDA
jgi:uncharacterized protein YndB with AHSA1/START domain